MDRLSVVLVTAALLVLTALLSAAVAAKLARLDGATYPAALLGAGAVFCAVLSLSTSVVGVLAQIGG
ncbi:hypothetical protein GCM10010300_48070 [Streptomyces olivaceoviridis]|uniref:hypothetical protein n=1 Tax=Streptomyces olivaceoviridis TaxID=1921 RepID=UPI00167A6088|nr:hypothetical protein [Streptomyces olivaceoviridis]GGY98343.1 hypothetical protein GCM10010300_48070 [Streptomyces olivaceoviridis]